uniref:GNAT family N-acetyltransferase n=1 Tax=Thaumasiovibrio occultus TaxID=1891184 RepID=UPI00131D6007|nr:GNAT family N-acetyltransferase [Thaumasiovibrio occultus]
MLKLSFHHVAPVQLPLVNKLYKSHYSAGKANKSDTIWVAKNEAEWCATVKFNPIEEGYFLSGLLVVPEYRGQGVGEALVQHVLTEFNSTCFCFAYSYLEAYYTQLGFITVTEGSLPLALQQRFDRYTKVGGKSLMAMKYQPTLSKVPV